MGEDAATPVAGAVETHLSTVLFTADRAFKLLKPVAFPFVDHRDRRRRLASTDLEISLNRRLAPDVYLGTADVIEDGAVVDRMIVMRRLPEERRLSALVADDHFDDHLREVARTVAAFHVSLPPAADPSMATAPAVQRNWEDNFTEIARHSEVIPGDLNASTRGAAIMSLASLRSVFEQRIAEGYVRDGHGDLIADDIFCLPDGPRILDCLAFDECLRVGDVLNDIGFLVMDVERLAGTRPATALLRWYQGFSNERHPPSLAHHYVAYRAHVRTKVACIRASQGDPDGVALAREYHALTVEHLRRGRARCVLVGGGPGVGKTTLAGRLAEEFVYVHLSTDEVRRDVTGVGHVGRQVAALDAGIYTPECVAATYAELRHRATLLLEQGHGVVLDATWAGEHERSAMRSTAARLGVEVLELECLVDDAIAVRRIVARSADPTSLSDATVEYQKEHMRRRDRWPLATRIRNDGAIDETVDQAIREIERRVADARRHRI